MVRQWQELFFDNRESGVDRVGNPDFVKLADARTGIKGFHIQPPCRRGPHPANKRSTTTTAPA